VRGHVDHVANLHMACFCLKELFFFLVDKLMSMV
jgi:hypothetical protein